MSLRTRMSGEPKRVLGGRSRAAGAAAKVGASPKPQAPPIGLPGAIQALKAAAAQQERHQGRLVGRVGELEDKVEKLEQRLELLEKGAGHGS